jgi:hypothetical protein
MVKPSSRSSMPSICFEGGFYAVVTEYISHVPLAVCRIFHWIKFSNLNGCHKFKNEN